VDVIDELEELAQHARMAGRDAARLEDRFRELARRMDLIADHLRAPERPAAEIIDLEAARSGRKAGD
jgi:hypothetical protein